MSCLSGADCGPSVPLVVPLGIQSLHPEPARAWPSRCRLRREFIRGPDQNEPRVGFRVVRRPERSEAKPQVDCVRNQCTLQFANAGMNGPPDPQVRRNELRPSAKRSGSSSSQSGITRALGKAMFTSPRMPRSKARIRDLIHDAPQRSGMQLRSFDQCAQLIMRCRRSCCPTQPHLVADGVPIQIGPGRT